MIGILDNNHPTRTHGGPHPAQECDRLAKMLEQIPAKHNIIGRRLIPVIDIAGLELHVRDTTVGSGFARKGELDFIHIDADDDAVWSNQFGKLKGDFAAPAADVDAALAGAYPGTDEERVSNGPAVSREQLQAIIACTSTMKRIVFHARTVRWVAHLCQWSLPCGAHKFGTKASSDEQSCHKRIIPSGLFSSAADTAGGRTVLDQMNGDYTPQRQIVTGMVLSDAGRIFLKRDIQHERAGCFRWTSADGWRLSAAHLHWASWTGNTAFLPSLGHAV
jgi:hypothetical protein